MAATILDLLEIAAPGTWQGESLMRPGRRERAYFFGSADEYLLGVRDRDWKYILNTTKDRDELYDLASDPTEQRDLARERREDANRLRRRTAAWVRSQMDRR